MSFQPWHDDADLPICNACMTQYPAGPRTKCPVCLDPRQFVPPSGQAWTSLRRLAEEGHVNKIVPDEQDERIAFIQTEPSTGIGQTPILIKTSRATYMWDCCAFLSENLFHELRALDPPLKAIAISHPHFYSTSLTWARCLRVPLLIAKADAHWYQRATDVKPGEIEWFRNEAPLEDSVNVIQCGGHFPGSSVLYWDRSLEPTFESERHLGTGIILCADTAMVQPTQKGFTFQWSVPNMIPLNPHEIKGICDRLQSVSFDQATSTWPNRFIRHNAREILLNSMQKQLHHMGIVQDGATFRIGSKSEMTHERKYHEEQQ
ncbi:hypothetical protein NliqN6_1593 [Naganishia liquefaciens]|uniref:MBL fold metallo-hydrolase n=1 Tax=Naganishia liquefaciens TaxID=104408 RepID=A0A8H3TQP2_9TREE|nr:hypothetical protein NliqN6_1593 [Naganishia liquefaciens]